MILLVIAVAGGVYLRVSRQSTGATFCESGMPIRFIDGKTVAVQVRGSGAPNCAVPETNPGWDTLGLDCKVRAPDGKVLETVKPSQVDGTC